MKPFFKVNPLQQQRQIKQMKMKGMTDSLSPWDTEPDPNQERTIAQKNKIKIRRARKDETINYESQKTRPNTRGGNGSRSTIKLQKRIPTEVIMLDEMKWEVELKPLTIYKNELIIKIPRGMTVIPPKKALEKQPKQHSKSSRQPFLSRQKISFKNFKQEIEELDRFKLNKKMSVESLKQRRQASAFKRTHSNYEDQIIKKVSLKNFNMYQQNNKNGTNTSSALKCGQKLRKFEIESKKHILDRILSRFD